jgi:hypothetical protein
MRKKRIGEIEEGRGMQWNEDYHSLRNWTNIRNIRIQESIKYEN